VKYGYEVKEDNVETPENEDHYAVRTNSRIHIVLNWMY